MTQEGGQRASEQNIQVAELIRRLSALEEENAGQRQRIAELERLNGVLTVDIAAARAIAKAHTAAAETLEPKLHRLASELEAQEARATALQSQVDTYVRSHSWRLTAPLRGIRRRFMQAKPWRRARVRGTGEGLEPSARPSGYRGSEGALDPLKGTTDQRRKRLEFSKKAESEHDRPDGPLPAWVYDEANGDFLPLDRVSPVETRIKLIAFYLPQFHPSPENDAWWGKGFTEWTNVTRAKPQFAGHYQPHLPGELGFYDLRHVEVQQRQIELAKLHGVYGFCYHHYWFGGTRLLRRPLEQFLAHPELDFPFCLCWANENWTRRWDGLEDELLIGQKHSPDDDLAFIRDIEPALRDPRYIRVGDRPLVIVYRPALFPAASATADRWRVFCREVGLGELFLASTHAFDQRDPRDFGFDAALEFAPNNMPNLAMAEAPHLNPAFRGTLYDYRQLVDTNRGRPGPDGYPLFRCVTPMWDNEPRRPSHGVIFANSSPTLYGEWLEIACQWTERHLGEDMPFVFVNAWNEWAEGAHLEPDRRYGYAYLRATAAALERFPT